MFFLRVLYRFFELPLLTTFSESPAFTLSGKLFSITKFIIIIVKSANVNDAKTNIQLYLHLSVPLRQWQAGLAVEQAVLEIGYANNLVCAGSAGTGASKAFI